MPSSKLVAFNIAFKYITGATTSVLKANKEIKAYVYAARDLALELEDDLKIDYMDALKRAVEMLPESEVVKVSLKQARQLVREVEDKLRAANAMYDATMDNLKKAEEALLRMLGSRRTPNPQDAETLANLLSTDVLRAVQAYRAFTPLRPPITPRLATTVRATPQSDPRVEALLKEIASLKAQLASAKDTATASVKQDSPIASQEPRRSVDILVKQLNVNKSVVAAVQAAWSKFTGDTYAENVARAKRNVAPLTVPTLLEFYHMSQTRAKAVATQQQAANRLPVAKVVKDPCSHAATSPDPSFLGLFNILRRRMVMTQLGERKDVLKLKELLEEVERRGRNGEALDPVKKYLEAEIPKLSSIVIDAEARLKKLSDGTPDAQALRAENLHYDLLCISNRISEAEIAVARGQPPAWFTTAPVKKLNMQQFAGLGLKLGGPRS